MVGENILDFAKRLSQCFSGRLTALQAMASSLPDVRGGNHGWEGRGKKKPENEGPEPEKHGPKPPSHVGFHVTLWGCLVFTLHFSK